MSEIRLAPGVIVASEALTFSASRSGGPGGRFKKPMMKRRVCRICDERRGQIDWKAVNYIRSFVTDRGKILAGRSKGTCSGCQRQLARAIKRARYMALIPTSPV